MGPTELIAWGPGAKVAMEAIRSARDREWTSHVYLRAMLIALATGTPPGDSALGRALREPAVLGL